MKTTRITLLVMMLLLLATYAAAAFIEGRIVADDEPVAGLRVYLYRNLDFA
nr:hypothetical protein [Desulfuromonadales bacterium]